MWKIIYHKFIEPGMFVKRKQNTITCEISVSCTYGRLAYFHVFVTSDVSDVRECSIINPPTSEHMAEGGSSFS